MVEERHQTECNADPFLSGMIRTFVDVKGIRLGACAGEQRPFPACQPKEVRCFNDNARPDGFVCEHPASMDLGVSSLIIIMDRQP